MVTPDGINHHGFMDPMLPNPSCFPYFPVGHNIESLMKTFPSEYLTLVLVEVRYKNYHFSLF